MSLHSIITDYVRKVLTRQCDHHDPKNWLDVGTDYRKWIKTECRQCGGFIGFRPPDGK